MHSAGSSVTTTSKKTDSNFISHVDTNLTEKAIFNEEGNLQSTNGGNEVLFRVHEKDESRDRVRVCFLLKMFTLGNKKKIIQILTTLYDLQRFDRALTKTDHLSEAALIEKILFRCRNNSSKKNTMGFIPTWRRANDSTFVRALTFWASPFTLKQCKLKLQKEKKKKPNGKFSSISKLTCRAYLAKTRNAKTQHVHYIYQ